MMSFQGELTEHKNRLSKWPIEDVRDLYRRLIERRIGSMTPPTTEEEAAAELLDENHRWRELRKLATPNLQAIVARDSEEESLDMRLAIEILSQREP